MKLVIGYPYPPIPTRNFDVSCTDDNYDITGFDGETGRPTSDYPIGYGPTEFDAIVEFVRELLLRNGDAQEMLVNCVPGAGTEFAKFDESSNYQEYIRTIDYQKEKTDER